MFGAMLVNTEEGAVSLEAHDLREGLDTDWGDHH